MAPINLTPYWTNATAFEAEGARVGLVTCLMCGAAVLLDPRDDKDPVALHTLWHRERGDRP